VSASQRDEGFRVNHSLLVGSGLGFDRSSDGGSDLGADLDSNIGCDITASRNIFQNGQIKLKS
jgi:hypothetical protein